MIRRCAPFGGPVALVLTAAGLAVAAPGPAPPDCSRYAIEGLEPGMRQVQVWRAMGGRGRQEIVNAGRATAYAVATYPGEPSVYVEYDVDRPARARLVLVRSRTSAEGLDPSQLVSRLGLPVEGGTNLEQGLRGGPAVWIDAACRMRLEVSYRDDGSWWNPEPPVIETSLRALDAAETALAVREPLPAPKRPVAAAPEPEPTIEPGVAAQDTATVAPPPPSDPAAAGPGPTWTPPQRIPRFHIHPEFPRIARKVGLAGRVLVQALVREDGTIGDVAVLDASHPGVGFEDAAVAAVRQWRYRPATLDGKPVQAEVEVVVEFDPRRP